MSFLYPRLLSAQAKPLFEAYGRLELPELTGRVADAHDAAVYVATGGDRVPPARLRELRDLIVGLAEKAGFPGESDRTRRAQFDLKLAVLLHREMDLVPAEAAAPDVWAFLALVLLPDVAFWRYPKPPGDRVLGTDLTRHAMGRLWWRAQLVHSVDRPEPYDALDILGEAAFDQIYARRVALGGSAHLVRSILRVWSRLDLTAVNERETLRDFLKRLLRLAPFVLFDGVEEKALDEELHRVAMESVEAQRGVDGVQVDGAADWGSRAAAVAPSGASPNLSLPRQNRRVQDAPRRFTSVEICAGAGAQALGLERAGFDPVVLIDSKADACFTIDLNRPAWDVICMDLSDFRPADRPEVLGVDLVSGGLPRVKSSAMPGRAEDNEQRNVLQAAVDLALRIRPKAVLLENLPELVESEKFAGERKWIETELRSMGYQPRWRVLNAADFGVPQNRSSGFLVALRHEYSAGFVWPQPDDGVPPTVGDVLGPSMSRDGWPGAAQWIKEAGRIAPALVGGSELRGGADLGPTGSKKAWAALRVNGTSLGDSAPDAEFPEDGAPRLTLEQAALIQAFPEGWRFSGGKTSQYRQIGHAMPPPLAAAIGRAIAVALHD
ncbi:DNA cytosine methyltransferase [Streptomyces goshikiensis]|uniref:DNA cytosine methyltransferase n=1 Tax=Streptomyces goshikiensis TaxID=1942 RepID=UPI0033BD9525